MRNVSALLVLCVTAAIAASASAVTNNQPVVGVLAVPAAQCTTRRRLSMSAGTGVRDGTMASDSATGSCFSTVYSKVCASVCDPGECTQRLTAHNAAHSGLRWLAQKLCRSRMICPQTN